MAKKEKHYQVGICPNCSEWTRQEYLWGENECFGEMTDRGMQDVYGEVHTFSLFRCDGCKRIMLYRTYYADAVEVEEAQKLDSKWVFQFDDLKSDSYFKDHSSLLYPLGQPDPNGGQEPESLLATSVPQRIRDIYEEARAVRDKSPNSFAVQVGRALEGIQKDLGIPRKQLEQLESHSPQGLGELALKIKDWRNIAAHYDTRNISAEQAEDIEEFFRLITEYVYVLPDKLKKARQKIEVTVDTSIDGIH